MDSPSFSECRMRCRRVCHYVHGHNPTRAVYAKEWLAVLPAQIGFECNPLHNGT